jgi:heme exporter protein D
MMPDLGDYAGAVLGAYASGLVLLSGLVVLSFWQARRAKAALERIERDG